MPLQDAGVAGEVVPWARISRLQKPHQQHAAAKGLECTMLLDSNAVAALELLEGSLGSRDGSLLSFLDHTATPAGKHLLQRWITHPLMRYLMTDEFDLEGNKLGRHKVDEGIRLDFLDALAGASSRFPPHVPDHDHVSSTGRRFHEQSLV